MFRISVLFFVAYAMNLSAAEFRVGPIEPVTGNANQCLQAGVVDRDRWPSQYKNLFSYFLQGRLLTLSDCDQGIQQQWQIDEQGIRNDTGHLMVKRVGVRFVPVVSPYPVGQHIFPVRVEQGRLVFEANNQRYCISNTGAPFFDSHSLAQCLESEGYKQSTRWLFALPPDPGEEGLVGLTGVDSNRDGVRDDIERFIEKELGDQPQVKDVARKLSSTDQQTITNVNDKAVVLENDEENGKNIGCLFLHMGEKSFAFRQRLKALTLNTEERIIAWIKLNSYFSGEELSVPDLEELDSLCNQ